MYNGISYNGKHHRSIWSSKTDGNYDDIELIAQDDHNVVLYDSVKSALWSTMTKDRYCPNVQLEKCMFQILFFDVC